MIVEVCVAKQATFNKRMYTREILQAQVDRLQPVVENRSMYCELGPVTESIIHLANVSHLIKELWLDDDKLMADIEILDTPCGKTLSAVLHNNPDAVSFKMVGVGSGKVDDQGILQIGPSYKLIQIEAILNPNYSNNITKKTRYRSIDDPWGCGFLLVED